MKLSQIELPKKKMMAFNPLNVIANAVFIRGLKSVEVNLQKLTTFMLYMCLILHYTTALE